MPYGERMLKAPMSTVQRVVGRCWGNRGGAGVKDRMHEGLCRARHVDTKLYSKAVQVAQRLEAIAGDSLARHVLDHREGEAALSGRRVYKSSLSMVGRVPILQLWTTVL